LDAVNTGVNGSGTAYTGMDCGITSTGDAWSVAAKLPGALTYFCVDSTGASKGGYTGLTGSGTTFAHAAAGGVACQ